MGFVRSGAIALIVGSVITCLVFAFHPSHIDPRPVVGSFNLSQIVHSAAIIGAPLLLYGIWALTQWLDWSAPARLALVCGAFALVLTANAAVISSFVTPAAARASMSMTTSAAPHGVAAPAHSTAAAPSAHQAHGGKMPPLVQLSVAMNRGLAQAHVALWSLSLLLFALGLRRRSLALCASGALVGVFPLAWQLSGTFSPDTHSMPIIVFAQSAWLIALAIDILRGDAAASARSEDKSADLQTA